MTNGPVVPKVLTNDEILNRMVNVASFTRYCDEILLKDDIAPFASSELRVLLMGVFDLYKEKL